MTVAGVHAADILSLHCSELKADPFTCKFILTETGSDSTRPTFAMFVRNLPVKRLVLDTFV